MEPRKAALQAWGGVECTVNRVADTFFDQMELSGHRRRISDLEAIASLGIKALRIGAVWERDACEVSRRWLDQYLHTLQDLNIRPIAGLVHHGSGPPGTSLIDPEFPKKLAEYAGSIAERYPWIDAFTPVNEPHTTSRFSGMYGTWYPHHTSRTSYLRALLHELKATVLSMKAIRRVRPDAQLIQTEDVGRISGTEELRHEWELLSLRRWLPFDLLCGLVNRRHPLFSYMTAAGLDEREILWFQDHPCRPDVIGINYYPTSDRFLDHRIHRYPPGRGSAEGPFVDVEAVRVRDAGMSGFDAMLLEAWTRYGIPVAITEVHLGGPVDEQIRWAAYAWKGAVKARSRGANCVAMTFWALLGSFYWNQLVTSANGHYEPGVFDVSSGEPRETELAEIVRQIAAGGVPSHPALASEGWWSHPSRVHLPFPDAADDRKNAPLRAA